MRLLPLAALRRDREQLWWQPLNDAQMLLLRKSFFCDSELTRRKTKSTCGKGRACSMNWVLCVVFGLQPGGNNGRLFSLVNQRKNSNRSLLFQQTCPSLVLVSTMHGRDIPGRLVYLWEYLWNWFQFAIQFFNSPSAPPLKKICFIRNFIILWSWMGIFILL